MGNNCKDLSPHHETSYKTCLNLFTYIVLITYHFTAVNVYVLVKLIIHISICACLCVYAHILSVQNTLQSQFLFMRKSNGNPYLLSSSFLRAEIFHRVLI